MRQRLIYRFSDSTMQLQPFSFQRGFDSTVKLKHKDWLSKLGTVRSSKERLTVSVDGLSGTVSSLWLANALIVDAPPEIHVRIESSPDIVSVHPDYEYYLIDFGSNDLLRTRTMTDIFPPLSLWHHDLLRLAEFRERYKLTGKGTKIGVLDTGVSNDDRLRGKIGGYRYVDRNGNIVTKSDFGEPGGLSHGTHVVGSIVSDEFGLAPDAQVFVASVNNGPGGVALWSQINLGLQWLISEGVHAINMSIGAPGYRDDLDDQFKVCLDQGIALFAAVGNIPPGNSMYPGNSSFTIAVGASAKDGMLIRKSGSDDKKPHVVAPGDGIFSTLRGGVSGPMTGTSQATPQVTGLFALLKEFRPDASSGILTEAIIRAAVPLPLVPLENQGKGIISLFDSLKYAETLPIAGAMLQSAAIEVFDDIAEIQITLSDAKIVFEESDGANVEVEVIDNNAAQPQGIQMTRRSDVLSIFHQATQTLPSYDVQIRHPKLRALNVQINTGTVMISGTVGTISIRTDTADIAIGKEDEPDRSTLCFASSMSGSLEIQLDDSETWQVIYNAHQGHCIVEDKTGNKTKKLGSGTLGNPNSLRKYLLESVYGEILINK